MHKFVHTLVAWGPGGILLFAILDSAGVPLPGGVDALLLLVSVETPNSAWTAASLAIVGSLIGNAILFSVARKGGQAYLDRHALKPRGRKVAAWFRRYGLVTVFVPALLPIPMPMKIPVISTAVFGVPLRRFLLVVAAARIPRYLGLAWLGVQLGTGAMTWIKSHAWQIGGFALGLFVMLYLLVRFNDRGTLAES